MALKDIEANVKKGTTPEQRGTALVNGVADELDGLSHDPVAIKALATELRGKAEALGAALVGPTTHVAPTTPQGAKQKDRDRPSR